MTIKVLPANQIGKKMGVKAIVYAGPGMAKTPLCAITSPNPIVILTEPGSLSISKTSVPCVEAYEEKNIEEVFDWIKTSSEVRKYQTLVFDSGSQIAETILKSELSKNRDGRKAYGAMSDRVSEHLNWLYKVSGPNVVIICKQDDKPDDGTGKKRPYWPGKDLHIKIPHLFDEILHLENVTLNDGTVAKGFRTLDDGSCVARDRSGALDALEPANLTWIFNKIESR